MAVDVMMMGPAPGRMGLVSGSRLEPGAVCARIDFWKWMTGLYRRARSWNGQRRTRGWWGVTVQEFCAFLICTLPTAPVTAVRVWDRSRPEERDTRAVAVLSMRIGEAWPWARPSARNGCVQSRWARPDPA